jgi:DNA-binding response OmpR family regulator
MAAALTRREAPEFVLIDACAPDFAAWRALSALQPDGVLEGTRVMLVAQHRDSLGAVEIGDFTVLTKPIFVERATDAILSYLPGVESGHVLVADEDPHVRQILTEALTAAGCRVTTVSEGAEAIRAMARKPNVALISLTLRGGEGIKTLASLRGNPTMHETPLIMLVPRELSNEQMVELDESVKELTLAGDASARSIVEMIRDAVARENAATAVEST